jgi:hypothetical protein
VLSPKAYFFSILQIPYGSEFTVLILHTWKLRLNSGSWNHVPRLDLILPAKILLTNFWYIVRDARLANLLHKVERKSHPRQGS